MNLQKLKLPFLFNERFLLEEQLGYGGMGVVFKAEDKFLKKKHCHKSIESKRLIFR